MRKVVQLYKKNGLFKWRKLLHRYFRLSFRSTVSEFQKNSFRATAKLSSLVLIGSIVLFLLLWIFFVDVESASSIMRNFLLGLAAIVSFPFLVWRTKLADEANQSQLRTFQNDIYIKAVEQLASDRESIRLAACHTFNELVATSDDKIFKEKIYHVLRAFMIEHSREVFSLASKLNKAYDPDINRKYLEAIDQTKKYHSQFITIIHLYNEYAPVGNWWNSPFTVCLGGAILLNVNWKNLPLDVFNFTGAKLRKAQLQGSSFITADLSKANLSRANLSYADLSSANLQNANLTGATLDNADLWGADLQGANLTRAKLEHAHLEKVKYNSKEIISPAGQKIKATIFPDSFDPVAHHMIDICINEDS